MGTHETLCIQPHISGSALCHPLIELYTVGENKRLEYLGYTVYRAADAVCGKLEVLSLTTFNIVVMLNIIYLTVGASDSEEGSEDQESGSGLSGSELDGASFSMSDDNTDSGDDEISAVQTDQNRKLAKGKHFKMRSMVFCVLLSCARYNIAAIHGLHVLNRMCGVG